MIVPMKKITVLVQEKDASRTVDTLRGLGLVHIEHTQTPQGQALGALRDDIALIDTAVSILSEEKFVKDRGSVAQEAPQDWKFICKHIIDLRKRLDQLEEYSRLLKQRIVEWEDWGDFDPDAIQRLGEKNIFIQLFRIPVKELHTLPAGVIAKTVFTVAGIAHCALIARQKIELPFKEITLPKLGLEKMRSRLNEDSRMMEIIQQDISKYKAYRRSLEHTRKNLEKELEFNQALCGMGKEGLIRYLSGFVPVNALGMLKQAAQHECWGLMIRQPGEEDNVPVLLKNPRWVRLIKPVLNLLGILPGYQELDVSLLFLVFFSVFFGILIGDAGYGLSYLLLTLWFQKKRGASFKKNNLFLLFYLLSSCAIIWGVLTGTFFGQTWLLKRGIKALVPALNNPVTMQTFCFFLGALHLSMAHSWRALLKFPSLAALADIGWVGVLWAAFFLARTLILAQPLPNFVAVLAWCAIALVVFFNSPHKNIFKAIGRGLSSVSFGLNFMSTFTDVVSYVRLFAVGLAGVAIAETTNAMTASLGSGPVALIAGIMIALIGHMLNIVLGPISVLVHGVRLNVLEFSGHASISWSGVAYKPLKSA
jgi:V/A-type H+-transporting ATPase subunit I